jgi:hypothetical protein
MVKNLENELTDTIELENGLTLEIRDRSKQIAGDRWFVSFVARVEIEVSPELFEGDEISENQIKDIQALAGEKASYQYENQRNFIDDTEKEKVSKKLKEDFLDTNLKYLSSPGFPKKLILSKIKDMTPSA